MSESKSMCTHNTNLLKQTSKYKYTHNVKSQVQSNIWLKLVFTNLIERRLRLEDSAIARSNLSPNVSWFSEFHQDLGDQNGTMRNDAYNVVHTYLLSKKDLYLLDSICFAGF